MIARLTCLVMSSAAVLACGSTSASEHTVAVPARQVIVGIDVSRSRTTTQLNEGQALLLGVIKQLSFGDRLVLIETYQRGRDDAEQSAFEMPNARDPASPTVGENKRLSRVLRSAQAVTPTFFRAKGPVNSTDLFSTFHRAAQYATARPNDTTIVLVLSDMLHSTRELDMEKGAIPDAAWINARKAEGVIPNLRGTCVVIVGADVSSRSATNVRHFWQRYLAAAGARTFTYRTLISDPSEVSC